MKLPCGLGKEEPTTNKSLVPSAGTEKKIVLNTRTSEHEDGEEPNMAAC